MRMLLLLICTGVLWPQAPASGDKCRIEGRVVNSVSGEPVRRVRVLASGQFAGGRGVAPGPNATRPPQFSTITDAQGRFAFDAIEPGRYILVAQRDGFGAATAQPGVARVSLSLAAGDKKSDVLLRVQPLSVIAGRVRDDQGEPLRRVSVTAMFYQYSARGRQLVLRGSAVTNDLGEYRIFDLAPGKYYLKATPQTSPASGGRGGGQGGGASDEDVLAAAFYPGVLDAAAAVPLDARPGEELLGIDVVLRRVRGVTVRGRVIPPAGVMGMMTVSIEIDQIMRAAAGADQQGNFELRGLAPGSYTLVSGAAVGGKRYSGRVAVQVGSADIDGLELRMQAPVDINGVARLEGGGNPGQVRVALMSNRGLTSTSVPRPSGEGAFTIRNVEPGVYSVSVTPGNPDQYVKSMRCGNSDVAETGIDLSGGAPCELSITVSANGGQIDGTVERDASASGTAVFIALAPSGSRKDPSLFKMSGVGDGGQFRLSGIAPGSYRLYAFEDVDMNAVRYDPDFLKQYETQGQSVQVSENSKQTIAVKVTQTGK